MGIRRVSQSGSNLILHDSSGARRIAYAGNDGFWYVKDTADRNLIGWKPPPGTVGGGGAGYVMRDKIDSFYGMHHDGVMITYGATQCSHAWHIIEAALQVPGITRGAVIATLMCALVESVLWMYANSNVPESFNYPHDRVGFDHESVGLFQQQPWWGPIQQLMQYEYSVKAFLGGDNGPNNGNPPGLWDLSNPTWDNRATIGTAVDDVQVSEFPYRYDRVESTANGMFDAMTEPAPQGGTGGDGFIMPFSEAAVSDEYGYRVHPISGAWRLHAGIDFGYGGVTGGTPIPCVANGTVIEIFSGNGGFGNGLTVQHDGGIQSVYAHLQTRPIVALGETVAKQQILGPVGTTGSSTGNHLHLEIWTDTAGGPVNPRDIIGEWP